MAGDAGSTLARQRTDRLYLGYGSERTGAWISGYSVTMDERDRQNFFAFIAVVVLLALIIWVGHAWAEHIKIENCIVTGRRNCVPLPMDQ